MLKAMRTGSQSMIVKLVLFGLLLFAMVGLAMTDVQGMFRSGLSDTTVARVAGNKISSAEIEHIVAGELRQQGIPEAAAVQAGMPQRILGQEINGRIYGMAANDLGLLIDDHTAARSVKDLLKPMTSQGITPKDALNRALTHMGMTEEGLVSAVRAQTATDTLMRLLSGGAHAPKQMLDDALQFKYESRRGEYFKLTGADAGKVATPSEDELKAYYKTISSRFAVPEYRSLAVLVLDKKALGIAQGVPDADLKKYYADHQSDYGTPETRVVSQVVASDEASAKTIYEAAVKSKDLQAASQAAGKGKGNYIKPQAMAEKDMPIELSPTAFKGKAGEVLPPLKSPLGWHVIYVQKINPGSAKSFESVKGEIEKEMSEDKSSEALYEQANKIDDMLGGGKTLDDVAAQFKLKPVAFAKIDAKGNGPDGRKIATDLPVFDKVLDKAFRLGKGETSQLIEAPTGAFLVVTAKDITPASEEPFEKVRAQVLDGWTKKQQTDLLDKQAAKIAERLKAGETFEKIAASSGKTISATDFVTRSADPAKLKLDRDFITALFALAKVGDVAPLNGDGGVTVLRLSARRVDLPKGENKEELAGLQGMLDRSLQSDILDQYRASLMAKYDVTINDKLMQQLFKPQAKEEDTGAE